MTRSIPAPGTLHFRRLSSVSGKFLREMDRVSKGSPWYACVVNGTRTEVRLGFKSGRVIEVR